MRDIGAASPTGGEEGGATRPGRVGGQAAPPPGARKGWRGPLARVLPPPVLALGAMLLALAASNAVFDSRHSLPPLFDERGVAGRFLAVEQDARRHGALVTALRELWKAPATDIYPPMPRIQAIPVLLALGSDPGAVRAANLISAALLLAAAFGIAAARASPRAGLLAAGSLLAMPGFVGFSRVLKGEFAAAAWVGLAVLLMVREPVPPSWRRGALLGAVVSAAILSKQGAAVYLVVPLALTAVRALARPRTGVPALLGIGASVLVLALPWYLGHAMDQAGLVEANTRPDGYRESALEDVARALGRDLMSAPLAVFSTVCLVAAWARPHAPGRAVLIGATALPAAVVGAVFAWENSRYFLPLLPLLAAAMGEGLDRLTHHPAPWLPAPSVRRAAAAGAVGVLAVLNLAPAPVAAGVTPPWEVHQAFQHSGWARPAALRMVVPPLAYHALLRARVDWAGPRIGVHSPTVGTEIFVHGWMMRVRASPDLWDGADLRFDHEWEEDPARRYHSSRGSTTRFVAFAHRFDVLVLDTRPPMGPDPHIAHRPRVPVVPGFTVRAEIPNPHSGGPVLVFLPDPEGRVEREWREWGGPSSGFRARVRGLVPPPRPGEVRYVGLFRGVEGGRVAQGEPLERLPSTFTLAAADGSFQFAHVPPGRYAVAAFSLLWGPEGEGAAPTVTDVLLPEDAAPLALSPGGTASGIRLSRREVAAGPPGSPAPGAR